MRPKQSLTAQLRGLQVQRAGARSTIVRGWAVGWAGGDLACFRSRQSEVSVYTVTTDLNGSSSGPSLTVCRVSVTPNVRVK